MPYHPKTTILKISTASLFVLRFRGTIALDQVETNRRLQLFPTLSALQVGKPERREVGVFQRKMGPTGNCYSTEMRHHKVHRLQLYLNFGWELIVRSFQVSKSFQLDTVDIRPVNQKLHVISIPAHSMRC